MYLPSDLVTRILEERVRLMAEEVVREERERSVSQLRLPRLLSARRVLGEREEIRQLLDAWEVWSRLYS